MTLKSLDKFKKLTDFILTFAMRTIAELAKRSPKIMQNSSSPSSRKKLDVRPFDRGHANATALSSSSVVSALGCELGDPGSSPGRGKALCP